MKVGFCDELLSTSAYTVVIDENHYRRCGCHYSHHHHCPYRQVGQVIDLWIFISHDCATSSTLYMLFVVCLNYALVLFSRLLRCNMKHGLRISNSRSGFISSKARRVKDYVSCACKDNQMVHLF